MANEEQLANDPHPGLPPNRRTDLGEGECRVFMKLVIRVQCEILSLPHFKVQKWGRCR